MKNKERLTADNKHSLPCAFEERFQLARARWMAQFAQRLCFDLADAFARDGKVLPDLFECVL